MALTGRIMSELLEVSAMNKIFVSYHYDDPNKGLAAIVNDLLDGHSLRFTTGGPLGGGELTPTIKGQIEDADALIALLTRRDNLGNGKWTTYDFCKTELQHARSLGKNAIAIVETGVDVQGLYQEHEVRRVARTKRYYPFDARGSRIRARRIGRAVQQSRRPARVSGEGHILRVSH